MVKLFKAESNVDGFLSWESMRFFWYCKDREKPAFPYEDVIMDYDVLDEERKTLSQWQINECFTETEIMELKEYLRRVYKLDLKAQRIQLPYILPDYFVDFPIIDHGGLFPLYKDEGYNLSILVVAAYYPEDTFPIFHDHLPAIHRKNGEMFANALLKKLNICAPTNLEKVVEEIYDETYLVVSKG